MTGQESAPTFADLERRYQARLADYADSGESPAAAAAVADALHRMAVYCAERGEFVLAREYQERAEGYRF
jgi:hypothetical protein